MFLALRFRQYLNGDILHLRAYRIAAAQSVSDAIILENLKIISKMKKEMVS